MDLQWTVYCAGSAAVLMTFSARIFQRPSPMRRLRTSGCRAPKGESFSLRFNKLSLRIKFELRRREPICRRCGNYHHITAGKGREPLGQGHGDVVVPPFPCAVRL